MAFTAQITLQTPAAEMRVTDLALVRRYHQTLGMRSERAFDGGSFDGIVLGGRGAVCGDIIDVLGLERGLF